MMASDASLLRIDIKRGSIVVRIMLSLNRHIVKTIKICVCSLV